MHRTRQLLAFLAITGITAIGLWHWAPQETSPPSLPAVDINAHLKQHAGNAAAARTDSSKWAQRLVSRKGAEDLESVTNTFKEASDCLLYYSSLREIDSQLHDARLDDLSHETLATLESIDATFSKYSQIARQTEALCKGSDREHVAQAYTDAMLKAALLGSFDAQSCYVMVGYRDRTTEGSNSPALRKLLKKRYEQHAPVFTRVALERGDPYVAQHALYRYIAFSSGHTSVQDDVAKPDPYLTWQAARLASLRGTLEQRKRLEAGLENFEKLQLLEPSEIQRADASAIDTYKREFKSQPPINLDSEAPCYSSPELAP